MGEVSETPAPVLVYNRIDANKRQTRLLLATFPLVFLPLVLASTLFMLPLARLIASLIVLDRYGPGHPFVSMWGELDAAAQVVSLIIAVLAVILVAAFLIARYGSRTVLRIAHARPLGPDEEAELVRTVENLCIGAGLPAPAIHLIESPAPNAFATGNDPEHASLVVTRGLLKLLDHRELEGVVAHELSHIGNHDIRLTTTLAALVGLASLPFRICVALCRCIRLDEYAELRIGLALWFFVLFFLLLPTGLLFSAWFKFGPGDSHALWGLSMAGNPLYVVFLSPVVAVLIRQAVSQRREFLADADAALLTRNPESLALALVKIGAVGGERLQVGEGTVHLYFVDPLSKGSWFHVMFPSHPSLEKRVELLARMGNGIASSAIQAARDAGAGYVFRSAPAVAAEHTLTPLYERPDGWSRVLAQLPESAVVIPIATDGDFIRVTTAEHQAGYVSRSAPLTALRKLRSSV